MTFRGGGHKFAGMDFDIEKLAVLPSSPLSSKLSQAASEDPAAYERVQFMKHFGA